MFLLVFFLGCLQSLCSQSPASPDLYEQRLVHVIDSVRSHDLAKAKAPCREGITQHEASNKKLTARLWSILGKLYWQEGELRKGVECHRAARSFYLEAGEKGKAAYSLSEIGIYLYYAGDRDSVMNFYLQSVEELLPTKHQHELSVVYYNIGNYFFDHRNDEKGRHYFEKGLAIARANKDTSVLINILHSLGKMENRVKNTRPASEYMEEALGYAEAINRQTLVGMISADLSAVYLQMGNTDAALRYGKKAMEYALPLKDISTYMKACISVAEVYEKTGREGERIAVLKKALAQEKEIKNVVFAGGVYKWLANASYKLGNYKKAFAYLQILDELRELTASQQTTRLNSELEAKYQAAQKEKELSQQALKMTQKEVQLQKTRQYLFFTLGISFIVLLAAALLYFVYRYKNRMHQQQLKTIQQEKEIHLLQALMHGEEKERSRIAKDLHDGVAGMLAAAKMQVSSLSSAFSGVENNAGYQQAMQLINEASREVRKTAHNLMPEVLTRYGLDEALRRYCGNISSENHLKVEYDFLGTPTRFTESFELSVYRIVQELLTNVIKHSKATEAVVQVSQQNEVLFITVEDNGIGFTEGDPETDGMGLHSLKSRVSAMNGKIDLQANAQIGVSAYLEFDITELKKEPLLQYELENTIGHH